MYMTNLELNTAIFNKLNDCATSVFQRSGLRGTYTAHELSKLGIGSCLNAFHISIGSFTCKVEEPTIFKVLSDFSKINGFRLNKFQRKFEDFKILGHVSFPNSAKHLRKFVDAKDVIGMRNFIQIDFCMNQAYAYTPECFLEVPFSFNGDFHETVYVQNDFIQKLGTDFNVVKDEKTNSVFLQNANDRIKVFNDANIRKCNFFSFLSSQMYNEKLIFKFDVKNLKFFFKSIKKDDTDIFIAIHIKKGEQNAILSFNDRVLKVDLLETSKVSFYFKITKKNLERLCLSNGMFLFSKKNLGYICSKTKEFGNIVISSFVTEADEIKKQIEDEDKKFLLYGIEM